MDLMPNAVKKNKYYVKWKQYVGTDTTHEQEWARLILPMSKNDLCKADIINSYVYDYGLKDNL